MFDSHACGDRRGHTLTRSYRGMGSRCQPPRPPSSHRRPDLGDEPRCGRRPVEGELGGIDSVTDPQAISSLQHLRRLKIIAPQPHPACITAPPVYPRITPALQQSAPPGFESMSTPEPGDGRARATGMKGMALGVAWEDLEELSLDNLSAQGVSGALGCRLTLGALHSEPLPDHDWPL